MKQPILSKEDFKRLAQLDRMELRQESATIARHFNTSLTVVFLAFWYSWIILDILLIGLLWVVTHSVPLMALLLELTIIVCKIYIALMLLALAADLYMMHKKRKAMDELQKDYLNRLPKKEKKKQ